MKHYKIKFSPFGQKKNIFSSIIYDAQSKLHAIKILNKKRTLNHLRRAVIKDICEVIA